MSTAMVVDRGYEVEDRGLVITRTLTYAEWRSLGRSLNKLRTKMQWVVGDWLAYGVIASEFRDYDDFYGHVVEITGRSYASIAHVVQVSQAFPLADRHFSLSWSHYREALRLPEADRPVALRAADMNRWSLQEFTNYIAGRSNGTTIETQGDTDDDDQPKRRGGAQLKRKKDPIIECPKCGHTWSRD